MPLLLPLLPVFGFSSCLVPLGGVRDSRGHGATLPRRRAKGNGVVWRGAPRRARLLPGNAPSGGQRACRCAHPDPPWGTTTPGVLPGNPRADPFRLHDIWATAPPPRGSGTDPVGRFPPVAQDTEQSPRTPPQGSLLLFRVDDGLRLSPWIRVCRMKARGHPERPLLCPAAWLWEGGSVSPLFFICIIRKGNGCSSPGRSRSRFGGFVVTRGPDLGASGHPASSKLSHDGVLSTLAPPRAPPPQALAAPRVGSSRFARPGLPLCRQSTHCPRGLPVGLTDKVTGPPPMFPFGSVPASRTLTPCPPPAGGPTLPAALTAPCRPCLL